MGTMRIPSPEVFIADHKGNKIGKLETARVEIKREEIDVESFTLHPVEITLETAIDPYQAVALFGLTPPKTMLQLLKRSARGKYLLKCARRGDFYRHDPKKRKRNRRNY